MTTQPETYHGAPCVHGHTLRYRSNRKCVTCACAPAQFFALSADRAKAWPVSMIEAAYARQPDVTYWKATELKP